LGSDHRHVPLLAMGWGSDNRAVVNSCNELWRFTLRQGRRRLFLAGSMQLGRAPRDQRRHMRLDRMAEIWLGQQRHGRAKLRLEVIGANISGGEKNRKLRAIALDPACQGEAIHMPRHLDIGEYAIERAAVVFQELQGMVPACGFDDRMSAGCQIVDDLMPDAIIILDNQNPQAHARGVRTKGRCRNHDAKLSRAAKLASKQL